MDKANTGDIDGRTFQYVTDQGTITSKSTVECLNQIGTIMTEMNRGDASRKQLSIKPRNGFIRDQNTGTVSRNNNRSTGDECGKNLDVGPGGSASDEGADLLLRKPLHQSGTETSDTRLICREISDNECKDVDVRSNDFVSVGDQHSKLTPTKTEDLCDKGREPETTNQKERFDQVAEKEADGYEKELSSVHANLFHGPMMDNDEDDDGDSPYNQFYFESDHLALKDNKHYHLLLQTLLVLESQRTQAVKDLDVLYNQQAKALQNPIGFVEKLQNNEPLNLPSRQKVVKLPSIPWEEYTVSLSAIDRQRLNNPHHTRAAASQSLARASETATNASDGAENASISSESNVYSVFGGEFVASKGGKPLDRESLTSVLGTRGGEGRSRLCDETKPVTFNQPWTTEEQAKLEKLLQIYPQEEVESKRWEKIAAALGNRTLKQVASRVQKYFIKLAKSGLPVPGRMPNLPRTGMRSKRSSQHYQALGFRNSTFFPSYRPKVLMDDDDDDTSSIATDDMSGYASEEDSIPAHLQDTDEFRELMELKRLKRQKIAEFQQTDEGVLHSGFMCDGCAVSPISGTRWHCNVCSKDNSVDFCTECVERGNTNVGFHTSEHSLEAVDRNSSFFVDGDYVRLSEGSTSAGYNYLDPNFLPSAR